MLDPDTRQILRTMRGDALTEGVDDQDGAKHRLVETPLARCGTGSISSLPLFTFILATDLSKLGFKGATPHGST